MLKKKLLIAVLISLAICLLLDYGASFDIFGYPQLPFADWDTSKVLSHIDDNSPIKEYLWQRRRGESTLTQRQTTVAGVLQRAKELAVYLWLHDIAYVVLYGSTCILVIAVGRDSVTAITRKRATEQREIQELKAKISELDARLTTRSR